MDIKQYFNHSAKSYWQNYEGDTIWAEAFRVRKALVLEMLEDKGKVIDVGCGPVIITSDLASRNNELWGVDISLEMIKLCRDSVATGCSGKGHFIVGDAKNLPFPDNFFDTAIAMGVLEYLDGRDEELTLDELLRVIKPQGHLILTLPNFLSPYRLWYRLLFSPLARWRLKIKNLFNDNNDNKVSSGTFDEVKHKEYTEFSLKRRLKRKSCHQKDIVYYCFNLMLSPLDILFPQLTATLGKKLQKLQRSNIRWLGTAFVIKLQKC